MLHHHNATPRPPERTVVLGAGGFIGGAIAASSAVRATPCSGSAARRSIFWMSMLPISSRSALRADDALVVVSARAPCKTPAMMLENIRMMAAVCDALAKRSVAHVVYISSDAVYADGPLPLTETSPAAPTSLHGAMHLAREQMLLAAAGAIAARDFAADAGLWRRRSA